MRRTILIATLSALVGALVATPVAVYASHSFNDVPNTNTFHDDIAWLADAGVTKGCNPPDNTEYCPKDEVTREQMAAFMRRLAENKVVDAATLDGKDGSHYTNPVTGTNATTIDTNIDVSGVDDPSNTIQTVNITAPSDGFLVLNGFASWRLPIDSYLSIQIDNTDCNNTFKPAVATFASGDDEANVSVTAMVPITKGDHTVVLCAGEFTADASQILDFYGVTAVFSG